MSREKGTSKPSETQSEGKEKPVNEFIKQLPAIIGAIAGLLTAIGTVVVTLHQAGLISFSASPTPTPIPSLTPTPSWISTPIATETPRPSATLAPAESPTLAPTTAQTPTPTATSGIGCPWLPFSTLNPAITIGQNCLNDLLNLGISETDRILFYRESGMNIGIFGISQKVDAGNEFSVDISIKELTAVRFLTLLSRQERGYQSSVGFRNVWEGNKKIIQLVRYDTNGYDTVVSQTNELAIWGGNLKLTLKINGSQVRAYVNNTYFGQTQIEFTDRYLFLGYQVMSGAAKKPYIYLSVATP